jgi:hypothetical protein
MDSLQQCVKEYTELVRTGHIATAYKGIMTFMTGLERFLTAKHPDCSATSLYFGYMDMTYFAFTPPALAAKKLKIAIVYLHDQGLFELWIGGSNRKIQAEYIELLRGHSLGGYQLSQVSPGVDSIIELRISELPDFDQPEALMQMLDCRWTEFAADISAMMEE